MVSSGMGIFKTEFDFISWDPFIFSDAIGNARLSQYNPLLLIQMIKIRLN